MTTLYATLGEDAIMHGLKETDVNVIVTSVEGVAKFKVGGMQMGGGEGVDVGGMQMRGREVKEGEIQMGGGEIKGGGKVLNRIVEKGASWRERS